MLNENIAIELRKLCEEVKKILKDRIKKYGYNERDRKNTLQGSELEKSISVEPIEYGLALTIADYWQHVSLGWERTGRYQNTWNEFLTNIDRWVTRKNIQLGDMTKAEMVKYIIYQIWYHGIRKREFMVYDDDGDLTKMIPELEGYIDEWFDSLFEAIITDLNKHFE